ncbi:hypothetical protein FHS77_003261, partial [Paenochrobactrum gallinarii]|nr:hypothetical protein [Paenochrobactrum gallinarii]
MSQNFEQDINVLICRHSYAASSAKTLNDEL